MPYLHTRPDWRTRLFMRRAILKQRCTTFFVRFLALLLHRFDPQRVSGILLTLSNTVLVRLYGSGYRLARQNLALWGFDDEECHQRARRYVIIHWLRLARRSIYAHAPINKKKYTLRTLCTVDPQGLLMRYRTHPAMVVLLHTGDYWIAVAGVLNLLDAPTHFVLPRIQDTDFLQLAALKCLTDNAHHTLEIVDTKCTHAALSLARMLRKRQRVIIFADLPAQLGHDRYGISTPGLLAGRPANFVKGPAWLAALTRTDILLAAHTIMPGAPDQFHALAWLEADHADVMQDALTKRIDAFIASTPENWFFLTHMETFFHHHRSLPIPAFPSPHR
jgi:hypothetical protein